MARQDIHADLRLLRQLLGQLEGKIPHKVLKEREAIVAQYHIQLANLERAIEQETESLQWHLNSVARGEG